MPVYNATHKFSIGHLVQIWLRGMETDPKKDHQGDGNVYLMKKKTKRFWLILSSKMTGKQEHNHSM